MSFPDPVIFDSLVALQAKLEEHVTAFRREQALILKNRAGYYRAQALQCYDDVTEQARLEGVGEGFALAAVIVDAPVKLEVV